MLCAISFFKSRNGRNNNDAFGEMDDTFREMEESFKQMEDVFQHMNDGSIRLSGQFPGKRVFDQGFL